MPGPLTLGEIASRLGGRVAGNPHTLIRQVGTLERAAGDEITFFANPRYKAQLAGTRAGAVIIAPASETLTERPRLVADNPYALFAKVSQLFNPLLMQPPGVHPSAVVAPGVRLGTRVSIGPKCVVGEGCSVGDDTCLYPGVVIYPRCVLGARVIVHAGAVIGADGFGIAPEEGRWVKIPQIGRVVIGDDVEIGAHTTIDRGAIDDTVLEQGVKLDNQIQIGHNVRIGAHTAIAACSGIAGSTTIGAHCVIYGGVRINGHISIADRVTILACTDVSKSILKPGGTYSGAYPFDEHGEWIKNTAVIRQLARLLDRVRKLEGKEKKNG
jgi:UDP-3-O-[3-hydroxymyristoyl] glucosamine N-acyltransferase